MASFSGFDDVVVDTLTGEEVAQQQGDSQLGASSGPIMPVVSAASANRGSARAGEAPANLAASSTPGAKPNEAETVLDLLPPLKLSESLVVPFLAALGAELESDLETFACLEPDDVDAALSEMAGDGIALSAFQKAGLRRLLKTAKDVVARQAAPPAKGDPAPGTPRADAPSSEPAPAPKEA